MENFEIYFLIVKFLRNGPCPEAAELLESALNGNPSALPPRLDWRGGKHAQTFRQLERQFPHVGDGHLATLCSWIQNNMGSTTTSTGPRSLLSLPIRPSSGPKNNFSTHQYLVRSQLGLKTPKFSVYCSTYQKLKLLRRTLGHLSAVFCLLFDKTGKYVFTGADDLLVKMWGTYNGRLYFTFRGANAEITDMAVSEDNRLLAAGSTDRVIRVWCLATAAPVAVLAKHTGTITALHFCPAAITGVPPYLAATSGDGTVSFWRYSYKDKTRTGRPTFDADPTRYHEKMRPGGAQMICAAFSPGGLFLATGSADYHVRVYMMDGKDGPTKVLEYEAHAGRVDSIQWANQGDLRFASGSKDGTARIWSFKHGEWHSSQLVTRTEDGRRVYRKSAKDAEEPLRVTMTTWSCDDRRLVTAVSDASLCVWDSATCQLLTRLKGHQDEVYVLEPHPSEPNILLSAAHDGRLIIWDMLNNAILAMHLNTIEGQGHGAIYDAKWSPDRLHVAASDSHGHVLFFGPASSDKYQLCPEEMFFHTDYRPLLRDAAHHVVDEQTQCAPHLLPPPFLVDVEGNPYPADIQRLVPGRENLCDQDALMPNLTHPNSSSPTPPSVIAATVRRRSGDRRLSGGAAASQPASNIDQLIAELAASTQQSSAASVLEAPSSPVPVRDDLGGPSDPIGDHSYASPPLRRHSGGGAPQPLASPAAQSAIAMSPVVARQSHSNSFSPATSSAILPTSGSIWRRKNLINSDSGNYSWRHEQIRRKELGCRERLFYKVELAKRRAGGSHFVGRHEGLEPAAVASKAAKRRREGGGNRQTQQQQSGNYRGNRLSLTGRTARERTRRRVEADLGSEGEEEDDDDDEEADNDEEEDEDFQEASSSDTSLDVSDLEDSESSSDSSSTEYSDWGANNLTPPQRTARKSGRVAASSKPATSEEEQDEEPRPGPSRPPPPPKRKNFGFDSRKLDQIPKEFLPSSWLAEYVPKKSPYFPQMGDEVMYLKQGHVGYINLVKYRNCYKLNMREQQWLHRDDIQNVELVKVIGMKYEIRPPRLCCLKLAIMDPETNQLTGENFSIKYHDMNDVVDFLVLRHVYEASNQVKWKPSDRYRCQIDDSWWFGSVVEVSPFDRNVPDSPFLSILCMWDSGEEERLSPWDLDLVDPSGEGRVKTNESVPVTKEEIERQLYQPLAEEWHGLNSRAECRRISRGLAQVMELAIAEPFNYPVDLTHYPDYMVEIEYPMDFSLIKSRLDNQFYRRTTAIQFDVRYIATNAECYNRPRTDIVKNARILTDLVLRVIQNSTLTDVNGEYRRLVDNFRWEDTQEPRPDRQVEKEKRHKSAAAQESPVNPKQWKHDCNELLNQMVENKNSEPFREAVSEIEFPDYCRIITTPMDLTLIRESLRVGEYRSPMDLRNDMELMFRNSMRYNTDKKSRVVMMTKRLKEFFLDKFQTILKDWRKTNRRLALLQKQGKSPSATPKKVERVKWKKNRKEETGEEEEDTDHGPSTSFARKQQQDSDDSESEEILPEVKRRLMPEISDTSETETKHSKSSKGKGKSTKAMSKTTAIASNAKKTASKVVDVPMEDDKPVAGGGSDHGASASGRQTRKSRKPARYEEEESEDEKSLRQRMVKKRSTEEDSGTRELPGERRTVRAVRQKRRQYTEEEEEEEESSKESESSSQSSSEESESHSDRKPRKRRRADSSEEEKEEQQLDRKGNRANKRRRGLSEADYRFSGSVEGQERSAPRPRRQATARALNSFQEIDTDDDGIYQARVGSRRQPARQRRRPVHHYSDESEEDDRPAQGPSIRDKRTRERIGGRGETSSQCVTISAADSSTDPRRSSPHELQPSHIRSVRSVVDDLAEEPGARLGTSGGSASRPQRGDRSGRSNLSARVEGDERERRRVRPPRRYKEDSDSQPDEEEGQQQQHHSPKARRHQRARPNYCDDFALEEQEEDLERIPYRKRKTKAPAAPPPLSQEEESRSPVLKRKSAKTTPFSEEEEESEPKSSRRFGRKSKSQPAASPPSDSEAEEINRSRQKKKFGKVKPMSESEEEEEGEERNGLRKKPSKGKAVRKAEPRRQEDWLQEEDSSDYGRRKRPRRSIPSSGYRSGRPQRSAGRSAMSNLRESSDEDLGPVRRHHRGNPDTRENSETEEAAVSPAVSSRGRVRRPNPRLLD